MPSSLQRSQTSSQGPLADAAGPGRGADPAAASGGSTSLDPRYFDLIRRTLEQSRDDLRADRMAQPPEYVRGRLMVEALRLVADVAASGAGSDPVGGRPLPETLRRDAELLVDLVLTGPDDPDNTADDEPPRPEDDQGSPPDVDEVASRVDRCLKDSGIDEATRRAVLGALALPGNARRPGACRCAAGSPATGPKALRSDPVRSGCSASAGTRVDATGSTSSVVVEVEIRVRSRPPAD